MTGAGYGSVREAVRCWGLVGALKSSETNGRRRWFVCGSRVARQVWERMEDRVEGCNSVVVRGRMVRISSRFEGELD